MRKITIFIDDENIIIPINELFQNKSKDEITHKEVKGKHMFTFPPTAFSIKKLQDRKEKLIYNKGINFNLNFFGGSPFYNVCNLALNGKIITHMKSFKGGKTAGKPQSTIYTTKDGKCGYIKANDLTKISNLDFAISGVPMLLNGKEVSLSRDIHPEGWSDGKYYNTWHGFLGEQDGKLIYIGAKVGSSNSAYATTLMANMLKAMGCTGNVIKLDGGGSFILTKDNSILSSTSENRVIDYVGVIK